MYWSNNSISDLTVKLVTQWPNSFARSISELDLTTMVFRIKKGNSIFLFFLDHKYIMINMLFLSTLTLVIIIKKKILSALVKIICHLQNHIFLSIRSVIGWILQSTNNWFWFFFFLVLTLILLLSTSCLYFIRA